MDNLKQFPKEVKEELKKVIWPSKDETVSTTFVVIVLVLIFAVYFGVVDAALSRAAQAIIG